MSVPNPHIRFRYEDYQTLPESMSTRYELLDGALIMVPAPNPSHQRVSRNLGFILMVFVQERKLGEIFYSPVDVVLGQGDDREIVQPDLLFIAKAQSHIVTTEEIQGAPALVVEILSPGTEVRDRGYKKVLYGRYGVQEYWIVDPRTQLAEVYVPDVEGFQLSRQYMRDQTLTSPLLPDLQVALAEVFRDN
jgi:Uma2 family endonuclease